MRQSLTRLLINTLFAAALLALASGAVAGEAPEGAATPSADALDVHGFAPMDLDGLVPARSAHFQAWAVPDAEIGMQNILEGAEAHRERIWASLGMIEDAPIRVLFLPDLNDYFKRRGLSPRAPSWAIGLAIPSESTLLVKWGRVSTGQWVALEPTFIHELAHMALDRAVGDSVLHIDGDEVHAPAAGQRRGKIPRWLHEGFAIMQAGEWSLERGAVLMQAGVRDRIIPLTHLHNGFPADGPDVELAYAESYHFVLQLTEARGQDALAPLIARMHEGHDFEAAYALAYQQSFKRAEADWRKRLNLAYTWIPLLTGSSLVWFLGGLVFILAWRRKRAQRLERLALMAAEEAMEPLRDATPLPGLGLTSAHAAPKPWRVLHDGTAIPNEQWERSLIWIEPTSDLPDDVDLPRTHEGNTLH